MLDVFSRAHHGSTVAFLLLQRFSVGVAFYYKTSLILVLLNVGELEVLHAADRKLVCL